MHKQHVAPITLPSPIANPRNIVLWKKLSDSSAAWKRGIRNTCMYYYNIHIYPYIFYIMIMTETLEVVDLAPNGVDKKSFDK